MRSASLCSLQTLSIVRILDDYGSLLCRISGVERPPG